MPREAEKVPREGHGSERDAPHLRLQSEALLLAVQHATLTPDDQVVSA